MPCIHQKAGTFSAILCMLASVGPALRLFLLFHIDLLPCLLLVDIFVLTAFYFSNILGQGLPQQLPHENL